MKQWFSEGAKVMTRTLVFQTWLCVVAACAGFAFAEAADRPNIILVFTDDQGYADLGIHGADPDVRTPHLDQLARDGALFTNGYVTAPQCIPSRAGLVTGRHQNAFGLDDNHGGPLSHRPPTVSGLYPTGRKSALFSDVPSHSVSRRH